LTYEQDGDRISTAAGLPPSEPPPMLKMRHCRDGVIVYKHYFREAAIALKMKPIFGQASVDSYVTLDFSSSLELGPGTLELGIGNLLNMDCFPIVSQLDTSELSNASARGRTVSINYSFTW